MNLYPSRPPCLTHEAFQFVWTHCSQKQQHGLTHYFVVNSLHISVIFSDFWPSYFPYFLILNDHRLLKCNLAQVDKFSCSKLPDNRDRLLDIITNAFSFFFFLTIQRTQLLKSIQFITNGQICSHAVSLFTLCLPRHRDLCCPLKLKDIILNRKTPKTGRSWVTHICTPEVNLFPEH